MVLDIEERRKRRKEDAIFQNRSINPQQREIYKELLDQDYYFSANCFNGRKDEFIKASEENGLEVKVHPRAFHTTGYEDSGMVAIFIRRKLYE